MTKDSEPIDTVGSAGSAGSASASSREDVISLLGVVSMKNVKVAFFIFILYVLISSTSFIENVLGSKSQRFAKGREATSAGMVLSGMILAIAYIALDFMVTSGLL
jgi:uncharacterized membrane protein